MAIPNKPGVYLLKALNNKLLYIGSTNSLQNRRTSHMSSIKKGNAQKGCSRMIEAYYAGDFVTFEVIEICDNYVEREQYWLDFWRSEGTYQVINQFDADRRNSPSTDEFRAKMSEIRKTRWRDPVYRAHMTDTVLAKHHLTADRLSKPTHVFTRAGEYVARFASALQAAAAMNYNKVSASSASRGMYNNRFLCREHIFIQERVLDKLDELLETHRELRAISSQAWEACNRTRKVQRLTDEQCCNNSDTSVQHAQ